jgi:hypothetical protein
MGSLKSVKIHLDSFYDVWYTLHIYVSRQNRLSYYVLLDLDERKRRSCLHVLLSPMTKLFSAWT